MTYPLDDVRLLMEMNTVRESPPSAERSSRLAALAATADGSGFVHAALWGRFCALIDGLVLHDFAVAVQSLAWCERTWDEHTDELLPEITPMFLLMYLAVTHMSLRQPRATYAQVDELVAAMTRRYQQYGWSMHDPYRCAHALAHQRGDPAEAQRLFGLWRSTPRGQYSPAMHSQAVEWLAQTGEAEAAVRCYREAVAGVTHNGSGGKAEGEADQAALHAAVLAPMTALGLDDDARVAHERGVHLLATDDDPDLEAVGPHLVHCATVGDLDAGRRLLERYLPVRAQPQLPNVGAAFDRDAVVLLRALSAAGRGGEELAAEPPRTHAAWCAELTGRAERNAELIDAVNGRGVAVPRLHAFWGDRPS